MRLVVSLTASLVLTACEADTQIRADEPEFRTAVTVLTGYHGYNWEHGHTLYALGLDGPVCIRGDHLELTETNEMRFVELHGHLSSRGNYGGMTQCTYAFEVTDVIEDRELTQGDLEVLNDLMKVVAEPAPGDTPGAQYELTRNR